MPRDKKLQFARLALIFLAAHLSVNVVVSVFQRELIYNGSSVRPELPTLPHLKGIEEVTLSASDGTKLEAWWWPGSTRHTILMLGGNAGDRGTRVTWMEPLQRAGYSVLMLDYRGFGGNEGEATEAGFYLDAQAAVDWLREREPESLSVIAESLGTGVGVEMAARNKLDALVLQSPYDSILNIAARQFWWAPVRLMLRDHFDSIAKIHAVDEPLLFIHGDKDTVIPWESGRRLFAAANEPKTWVTIKGAGHRVVREAETRYFNALLTWLDITLGR